MFYKKLHFGFQQALSQERSYNNSLVGQALWPYGLVTASPMKCI